MSLNILNQTKNRLAKFDALQTSESDYAINAWSTEFKNVALKKRFRYFILPYDLHAIRVVLLAGAVIYPLFCILDYMTNPAVFSMTFFVRLFIIVPGLVLTLRLTFVKPFKNKYHAVQNLTLTVLCIGQIGHFIIGIIDGVYEFHLLIASILLAISGNTLMGIRFKNNLIINVVCLIIFELIIIGYLDFEYKMIVYQNFILIAVILITLHTCYLKERDMHRLFIQYDTANQAGTELKKGNHHLEELLNDVDYKNKELEHYAYVVSHDLKAPLRIISGLVSLVERKEFDKLSEQSRDDFEMIKDQSKQMAAMIDGVLEYSRIGRIANEIATINVVDILEKIKLIEERNENVMIDYSETIPPIRADRTRVEQVFQNIIDNAIKYNDKAVCKILIQAEVQGKFVLFRIEDNGPGILPEYSDRIFTLFQTLQSKKQDSTGIGLAIVKKIISHYRGEIYIDTSYQKGACFCFTLPYYSNID